MHYSGVLVRSRPQRLGECAAQVAGCDGVDVYAQHEGSSSLVAVIESATLDGQEARLRAIQDLSAVASANLVYHRADEDEGPEGTEVAP